MLLYLEHAAVFSCGAVVRNGEVWMCYGGADRVMALATAPVEELVRACL